MSDESATHEIDEHPDPLTGEPEAHPIGVGAVGAGAAAGALGGAVAGPVGAALGAVIGALTGGLMGKAVVESLEPTPEDLYWQDHFRSRPYVAADADFEDYRPAFRYGWESRPAHGGKSFARVEPDLALGWEHHRGHSQLNWEEAREAVRDAWDRWDKPGGMTPDHLVATELPAT